jgi:hypothetical protein
MHGSPALTLTLPVDDTEGSVNEIGNGSVAGIGNHVDTVGSF